jgi:hypothetical protein
LSNNKGLGLRQTKGYFQVKGKVTGVEKENFYTEGKSRNGKDYRRINFGVEYQPDCSVYVQQFGMPQNYVYYSKQEITGNQKKTVTEKVNWSDRFKSPGEDYRLVGVNCGVEKVTDKNGKLINNKKILTQFDACNEIAEHLNDGDSVFVRGNIIYSTYEGSHKTSFDFTQVSLCDSDINFKDEKFKSENKFKQEIVFMGIDKSKEIDGEFIISGKVVNYDSIEDVELYTRDNKLASILKKNCKPYNLIELGGNIFAEFGSEKVESDDEWGVGIEMNKVKAPYSIKLMVNGADKSSLDTTTYSEEIIEEALVKQKTNDTAKAEFSTKTSKSDSDDWDDVDGEEWD